MKAKLFWLALLAAIAIGAGASPQAQPLASEEVVTTVGPPKIPGYFDPATSTFRPLPLRTDEVIKFQGQITVHPTIEFHSIHKDETVFCDVIISFGPAGFHGLLAVDATARASVNFSSDHPPGSITVPFAFDGDDDTEVQVSITCRIADSYGGASYSQTVTNSTQPAKNGTSNVSLTLYL